MKITANNFPYYVSVLFYNYLSKHESVLFENNKILNFEDINEKNLKNAFLLFSETVGDVYYKKIFDHLDYLISQDELENIINYFHKLDLKTKKDFKNKMENIFESASNKTSIIRGENFSNEKITDLIFSLINLKTDNKINIYDPTLGFGGFLLKAYQCMNIENYYGDEVEISILNIAKMRILVNGIDPDKLNFRNVNSIIDNKYENETFNLIVSEPPFSEKIKFDEKILETEPFLNFQDEYKSVLSEYSFIIKSLSLLKNDGQMIVFAPSSIIFKANGSNMRKTLIKKMNVIDAIVSIPEKVLSYTNVETNIIIFKKNREKNAPVIFMDIQDFFNKTTKQNTINDNSIKKIAEIYNNKNEYEKVLKIVDLNEIEKNDYNLNVSRYIQQYQAKTRKSNEELKAANKKLFDEMLVIDSQMQKLLVK